MKISRKSDYALRALFALVDHRGKGPISLATLARLTDTPKRFLEHIMLDLKSRGWVGSAPGRTGGYELVASPESLTLGQVVRHFDGVLAPIGCVSLADPRPCSQSAACRFRRILLEVRNLTARYMDGTTLAQAALNAPVSDTEVIHLELSGGGGI